MTTVSTDGKGKKAAKKKKPIDWASDAYFDKNRAFVYIEHTEECPIFKTKALEFPKFLEEKFPDKTFLLVRNETPPREGAFEISFSQNARTDRFLLWSGLKKGPPRRDKFPETFDILLPEANYILSRPFIEEENTAPEEDEAVEEPPPEEEPVPEPEAKSKKSQKVKKKRAKGGQTTPRQSSTTATLKNPVDRSLPGKTPTIKSESENKNPPLKIKRLSKTKPGSAGHKKDKNKTKKKSLSISTNKRVLGAISEKGGQQK